MRTADPLPGHVYFVGGGPGDPGLLTLKGAHYLQQADVIVYDELLDGRLLELARDGADQVCVGKRGGRPSHSQAEIDQLLADRARRGRVVVRLKGGDPFVFGRGGEEAMALAQAGIPFEIVPGVTAATAVPAYAGIPLTHRNLASSAVMVTGHQDPARSAPAVDWNLLARFDGTLVIFMGARRLVEITAALQAGGRPAQTPAAAIEWGTRPQQRTVVSTLEHLAGESRCRDIQSPALLVVGDVVGLRQHLNWFESKPLFGRQVLITRRQEQAGDLRVLLEARGARVEALPLLEIRPPDDWSEMDRSMARLERFDWVVFTSPNSVDFFFARLRDRQQDARAFGHAAVAAVGGATAEHLRLRGVHPDLVPQRQSQEGLVEAFAPISVAGREILLPASAIGRPLLADELERRGAAVRRVVAYQNRPPDPEQVELPPALVAGSLDLVVFASSSSVEHFSTLCGPRAAREMLGRTAIASIGPSTSEAIRALDLEVHIQPEKSSIPALVEAICAHYGESAR